MPKLSRNANGKAWRNPATGKAKSSKCCCNKEYNCCFCGGGAAIPGHEHDGYDCCFSTRSLADVEVTEISVANDIGDETFPTEFSFLNCPTATGSACPIGDLSGAAFGWNKVEGHSSGGGSRSCLSPFTVGTTWNASLNVDTFDEYGELVKHLEVVCQTDFPTGDCCSVDAVAYVNASVRHRYRRFNEESGEYYYTEIGEDENPTDATGTARVKITVKNNHCCYDGIACTNEAENSCDGTCPGEVMP